MARFARLRSRSKLNSATGLDPPHRRKRWNLSEPLATAPNTAETVVANFLFNFISLFGGRTRARTWDPLIKSQPLNQLSSLVIAARADQAATGHEGAGNIGLLRIVSARALGVDGILLRTWRYQAPAHRSESAIGLMRRLVERDIKAACDKSGRTSLRAAVRRS